MTVDFTYDEEIMHGDCKDSIEWFYDILHEYTLQVGEFQEIGDFVGTMKLVDLVHS